MTRIDQFESVFKAAARTVFTHQAVTIRKVLLVTDLADADAYATRVRSFLGVLDDAEWRIPAPEHCHTVGGVLELVEAEAPDLVCTYRNLHTDAWRWPYCLGDQVEVLTQATSVPVLLLPRPEDGIASTATDSVMALTDHLSGDARLVSFAARCTAAGGTLWLTHLEDERTFERYLDVISKIPEIDTEAARRLIGARLLREAEDYVASCQEVLRRESLDLRLAERVAFGHHLDEIRRMIGRREVDLAVLNTKDEDQLAMHGLAHPLAVETRSLPMLLL